MNSAYQEVYGKSYYEIMALVNEEIENAEEENETEAETSVEAEITMDAEAVSETVTADEMALEEEVEPEIPISEFEKQGRERINEKYWPAWSRCVEIYEGDAEKEKDLDICLSIIGAIDENDLELEEVMASVWNLDCSKEKFNEILDILETFGDKGYYIAKKARSSKGFKRTNFNGDENYSIYIDKDTRCQYLWVKDGSAGGLQLIVNADGTPKLYEGDVHL